MNRPNLIRSAIALTFTSVLACGSDTTAPVVVTSVAGAWKLTAVNSKPLPFLLSASDPKLELIDKGFVISATGTFKTAFTLRATELDGSVTTGTTSDSGTVTLANNTATFTYASDGSGAVASVTPTMMTIGGSAIQEFTKQ